MSTDSQSSAASQAASPSAAGRASQPYPLGLHTLRRRALALGGLALLSRLPFVARRMWDHDSVQFALGAERFDLLAHHPHPPGYPLYIGWIRGLGALGIEPVTAMVILSVLAAAVGCAAAVALGERWARLGGAEAEGAAASGLLAGVLWIAAPTLWFYGELPLVYAVEAAVATLLGWLAVELAQPPKAGTNARLAAAAAALYAAAAGLRPSTAVLLAPLMLWALFQGTRRGALRRREWLTGALGGVTVGLAWGLPFLHAVGGLAAYRQISGEHFGTLLPKTSVLYGAGFAAVAHHFEVLVKWTLQGLMPALAVGLFLLAGSMAVEERSIAERLHAQLLACARRSAAMMPWLLVWVLPPIAFFLLFHITKAGYTFVFLPALICAAAVIYGPLVERGVELPEELEEGEEGPTYADFIGGGGEASAFQATDRSGPRQASPESQGTKTASANTQGAEGTDSGSADSETWDRNTSEHHGEVRRRWLMASLALGLLVGSVLFLLGAQRSPSAPKWQALVRHEHNLGALRSYERELDSVRELIAAEDPATTALVTVELAGGGGAGAQGYVYPWHRHLQWYAPEHVTAMLAPDAELALVAAQGHGVLTPAEHGVISLPAKTRNLLFILSAPAPSRTRAVKAESQAPNASALGERFPLPPSEVLFAGSRLRALRAPFSGSLELGDFLLVAGEVGEATVELEPFSQRSGDQDSGNPGSTNSPQDPSSLPAQAQEAEETSSFSESDSGRK
ncbi:MAG: DUF2723 domain-containing protein [Acidobacteriota bacterium]